MTSETESRPNDRRPIKSRDTRWAEAATQALVNTGVSPNTISVIGMIAALAAGVVFVTPPRTEAYGPVAVFVDIAGNRWDLLGVV